MKEKDRKKIEHIEREATDGNMSEAFSDDNDVSRSRTSLRDERSKLVQDGSRGPGKTREAIGVG